MSRTLENKFSWSKSRDELFRECHHKYYYDKYGFWGGWRSDADPGIREIYILKQVRSRRMWLGEAVHRAVENALKGYQSGREPSQHEILKTMTEEMRQGYRQSREGSYRADPKHTTALFEHVYGLDVSREEWVRIHETACRCVDNFFTSDLLKRALAAGTEHWLPVEEFQSFVFNGVTVYVKLDFAFREGKRLIIVDWKTGMGEDVDVTVQLGCYALYAAERWGVAPGDIQAIEFNLNKLKENSFDMIEARLEWARHYIRNSMAAMQEKLVDPKKNQARIEDFERTTERKKCRWCNYRKVCLPDEVF